MVAGDALWRPQRTGVQKAVDKLWVAGDQGQVRARRLIRLRPALLPVPQGSERYVVALGEFFLGQMQSAADNFRARNPLHPSEVSVGERLRVWIGKRGLLNFLTGHRSKHFL